MIILKRIAYFLIGFLAPYCIFIGTYLLVNYVYKIFVSSQILTTYSQVKGAGYSTQDFILQLLPLIFYVITFFYFRSREKFLSLGALGGIVVMILLLLDMIVYPRNF